VTLGWRKKTPKNSL
ncbi:putative Peptidyl-prolyl cis-trans isomerase protein, partial [Naja naja]